MLTTKPKILFLCTGNSCRSQMAEGLCRSLRGDMFEAYSAGIETHGLNPNAVTVMSEIGINIKGHKSQNISEFKNTEFEYVITVCDNARESCPFFPARTMLKHRSFADPPKLAATAKTEDEKLGHYRRVRDEIREFILSLPGAFESDKK